MIEIALAHPEVSKWLETADVYSTEVGWSAVGWNDSEATGWARLEYEEIADCKSLRQGQYQHLNFSIFDEIFPFAGRVVVSGSRKREGKNIRCSQHRFNRPIAICRTL